MNTLGERLEHARTVKGWLQTELADKINIGRSTISQYETGRAKPSAKALIKIAKVLEVDVTWLKDGEVFKHSETSPVSSFIPSDKPDFYTRALDTIKDQYEKRLFEQAEMITWLKRLVDAQVGKHELSELRGVPVLPIFGYSGTNSGTVLAA